MKSVILMLAVLGAVRALNFPIAMWKKDFKKVCQTSLLYLGDALSCEPYQTCFYHQSGFMCAYDIGDQEVCEGTVCNCTPDPKELNPAVWATCVNKDKCHIKDNFPICGTDFIEIKDQCQKEGCMCKAKASADKKAKAVFQRCQVGESCYQGKGMALCGEKTIAFNQGCDTKGHHGGRCVCTGAPGNTNAFTYVMCEQDEICLSGKDGPVCVMNTVVPGVQCLPKWHGEAACKCYPTVEDIGNDNASTETVYQGRWCFQNQETKSMASVASVIKVGEKCETSGGCGCFAEDSKKNQVMGMVSHISYCDVINDKVASVGQPIEVGFICRSVVGCLCGPPKVPKNKRAQCDWDQICQEEKGAAVCVKLPIISNAFCKEEKCACNPEPKALPAYCSKNQFCTLKGEANFCTSDVLTAGEACAKEAGCACAENKDPATSTSTGVTCQKDEICGLTKNTKSVCLTYVAKEGEEVKSGPFLCKVESTKKVVTTQACVHEKERICVKDEKEAAKCVGTVLKHKEQCNDSLNCVCRGTVGQGDKAKEVTVLVNNGNYCYSSDETPGPVELRAAESRSRDYFKCSDPKGCLCAYFFWTQTVDMSKAVYCKNGQFCLKGYKVPTCFDMWKKGEVATVSPDDPTMGTACIRDSDDNGPDFMRCPPGYKCAADANQVFCLEPENALKTVISPNKVCSNKRAGCKCVDDKLKTNCVTGEKCEKNDKGTSLSCKNELEGDHHCYIPANTQFECGSASSGKKTKPGYCFMGSYNRFVEKPNKDSKIISEFSLMGNRDGIFQDIGWTEVAARKSRKNRQLKTTVRMPLV